MPVCPRQDPRGRRREHKYQSEHDVDLQGEDKEREKCETPSQEVKCNSCVVMRRQGPRGIILGRERQSKSQGWELDHAKGQPEYGEEPHDHHREEIAHNPFEDHGKDEKYRAGEEENTPDNA